MLILSARDSSRKSCWRTRWPLTSTIRSMCYWVMQQRGQELQWLAAFSGKRDICTSTRSGPLVEHSSNACVYIPRPEKSLHQEVPFCPFPFGMRVRTGSWRYSPPGWTPSLRQHSWPRNKQRSSPRLSVVSWLKPLCSPSPMDASTSFTFPHQTSAFSCVSGLIYFLQTQWWCCNKLHIQEGSWPKEVQPFHSHELLREIFTQPKAVIQPTYHREAAHV